MNARADAATMRCFEEKADVATESPIPEWLQPSGYSTWTEMKRAKRWLLHKGKTPFYVDKGPRRGPLDGPEDIARLSTFDEAQRVRQTDSSFGLGFALGDGWQGIDLDNITDQNPHLQPLVAKLPGYVEYSPSGKGVHAIGRGPAFAFEGCKNGKGVEVYCGRRYFTVTEDMIKDGPLQDLTPFIEEHLLPLMRTRSSSRGPLPTPIDDGDWERVIPAVWAISPDCSRDEWIKVGMALHSTGRPEAFGLWQDWSEGSPEKYPGEKQLRQQWQSFRPDHPNGVTLRTLFLIAENHGWERPRIDGSHLPWDRGDQHRAQNDQGDLRYRLRSAVDLLISEPIRWRVKNVVPDLGLAALYGPPSSGKSFLVVDMAIHIAKGERWFGYRVQPCPVTYVCLEGEAGLSVRLAAYLAKGGIPRGLGIISQPVNLLDTKDVCDLVQAIKANQMGEGIVIIDTLNRAAPGADENSSSEMGKIINACEVIQQGVGGLVLLVHHVGKNGNGMRGHSSLHAALDAAIEVKRSGDNREWLVAKAKDGADGKAHPFMLDVVNMGEDGDGDPITSCVIRPSAGAGVKAKPLTHAQQLGMDAFMAAASANIGGADQSVHAHFDQWRVEFFQRSTADTKGGKRSSFSKARRELVSLGKLVHSNDVYRLPNGFQNIASPESEASRTRV